MVKAIAYAKAKTDKVDARILAVAFLNLIFVEHVTYKAE